MANLRAEQLFAEGLAQEEILYFPRQCGEVNLKFVRLGTQLTRDEELVAEQLGEQQGKIQVKTISNERFSDIRSQDMWHPAN